MIRMNTMRVMISCTLAALLQYAALSQNASTPSGGTQPAPSTSPTDSSASTILECAGITGAHSDFHGYDCCEFLFEGHTARVVRPRVVAEGKPWIWRARFWEHEPQADIALLSRGFHVAFCDVSELYANAEAIGIWDRFYRKLTLAGLCTRVAMEGLSRGGIYIYRWAAAYPGRIACIYADAPVLDIRSWPGGKGKSKGNPEEWERLKRNFGIHSEEEARAFKGSPLDLADSLARCGFPMLHVCGDADDIVPIDENTDLFEQRVLAAGGSIRVIRKPGVGHHPHSLVDPAPIVDFVLAATATVCK
jgi:pimeloyl-ACP methyl ester carboxylesterase